MRHLHWLKVSALVQIRNAICIVCLIVFAFFEVYSALSTVSDKTGRFPAWEAKLGWGLFVLPSLVMIGLVLLLFGKRSTLGFGLVASSLLLYLGFLLLEVGLTENVERADWIAVGIWAVLCAIATLAAWLLSQRSTQL